MRYNNSVWLTQKDLSKNDSDMNTLNNLELLEEVIGYHFKDKCLIREALTHPSFAYESKEKDIYGNGRLEFLGDSVLGLVVSEHLCKAIPRLSEGELTRQRSLLVNRDNLSRKAKEFSLAQYLLLGKGEEKTGGRQNATNLAGVLEALIAGVYIDGGLEEAKGLIMRLILEDAK